MIHAAYLTAKQNGKCEQPAKWLAGSFGKTWSESQRSRYLDLLKDAKLADALYAFVQHDFGAATFGYNQTQQALSNYKISSVSHLRGLL